MRVVDLILKLQQLPPNSFFKEVMLDHTREETTMFKFVELNVVDEVTTGLGEEIVLLTPYEYTETEDGTEQSDSQPPHGDN